MSDLAAPPLRGNTLLVSRHDVARHVATTWQVNDRSTTARPPVNSGGPPLTTVEPSPDHRSTKGLEFEPVGGLISPPPRQQLTWLPRRQRWPPFDPTVDWRSTAIDQWLTGGPAMVDRWSRWRLRATVHQRGQYEVQNSEGQYEVQNSEESIRGSGCTRWLANHRLPRGQNDKNSAVIRRVKMKQSLAISYEAS
ncbi:hypothetical protein Tco_0002866 [Tanacetum coccineum]